MIRLRCGECGHPVVARSNLMAAQSLDVHCAERLHTWRWFDAVKSCDAFGVVTVGPDVLVKSSRGETT